MVRSCAPVAKQVRLALGHRLNLSHAVIRGAAAHLVRSLRVRSPSSLARSEAAVAIAP
jgi:hypothetical protein